MKEFVEKLIERLEENVKSCEISMKFKFAYNRDYQYVDGKRVAFNECVEIVNQLAEEYNQDSTKNNQGWILCSERLPKTNGVYQITRELKVGEDIYRISGSAYFDGQDTWHNDNRVNHGREYLKDIVAWKPLPEPYEREE